jgi:hypothetical protein
MATQYGRIDHDALRTLAHNIAAQYPGIRAAGITLAELIGLQGETCEPFVQAFGDNLVESLMHMGRTPSMGYNFDFTGASMVSQILVAACKDVGISPDLIPSDFRLHVSNLEVVLARGGKTKTVWRSNQETLAEQLRRMVPELIKSHPEWHDPTFCLGEMNLDGFDRSTAFHEVGRDRRRETKAVPPGGLDPFANE